MAHLPPPYLLHRPLVGDLGYKKSSILSHKYFMETLFQPNKGGRELPAPSPWRISH